MTFIVAFFLINVVYNGFAQVGNTNDTLATVVVNVFESNKNLLNVAAPVNVIGTQEMNFFDNTSVVNSVNMIPGLNMDERSPGSYRLNFRGSSVRSTFGVRNVKVYYNGIPFTSATGDTPLQMLGFHNFSSIEVIKGPSSSVYGSGTGGVMLIEDRVPENTQKVSYSYGSFNTGSLLTETNVTNSNLSFSLKYNRQNSDGFRDHTRMHRDVLAMSMRAKSTDKQSFGVSLLYSNLFYQTPGGLTLDEYKANPRRARPKSGIFESSEDKNASLRIHHLLLSTNFERRISENIRNKTTFYGAYNYGISPTIRNYSRANSVGVGGRTNFDWVKNYRNAKLKIDIGGEYQFGIYTFNEFQNIDRGQQGPLNSESEIKNTRALGYVQAETNLENGFSFTLGTSINFFPVTYRQFYPDTTAYHRKFKNRWTPRFSVLKTLSQEFSLYASTSAGFNPPTTTELFPTTREFNQTLEAETSFNYEVGGRGSFIQDRLFIDFSIFLMEIKNSPVQNQDSGGGVFFVNAGRSQEKGIELLTDFQVLNAPTAIFDKIGLRFGGNLYHFRYKQFEEEGGDFSGNKMPGTSPTKITTAVDLSLKKAYNVGLTSIYNNRLPLNDANTEFANSYWAFNISFNKMIDLGDSLNLQFKAGIQNLFNEIYSLGNDINAVGGRYYNVAPGRSLYGGISINI